ncbi:MAG: phosphatase PAP2 family protein [Pseudacidovorax sp.]|uniref:phosphatase PAP2 family protein n=1 Tax=Pseudacidovorax sp. TaxID=1934311 RepID=UPI001B3DD9DC|nr:phosphatase PAP2 family protein [Pseudacidovorax sp.]MBP6898103.1 phosphatase PAP2 family protein [Pseudacidovorax sp.]
MSSTPTSSSIASSALPMHRLPLAVAALLLGALLLRLTEADLPLFRGLNTWAAGLPETLWSGLSVLGLGLSIGLVGLALSPGRERGAMRLINALMWAFPLGGLLSHVPKRLFVQLRPPGVLPPEQLHVIGDPLVHLAMPSGHALAAVAFVWVVLHTRRCSAAQRALLWGMAAAVALSRIAVGAHWPSDVLAGAALGLVAAALSLRAAQRWDLSGLLTRRRAQAVMAAVQLGAGLAMLWTATGYPLGAPVQWALGLAGVAGGLLRLRRVVVPAVSGRRSGWMAERAG